MLYGTICFWLTGERKQFLGHMCWGINKFLCMVNEKKTWEWLSNYPSINDTSTKCRARVASKTKMFFHFIQINHFLFTYAFWHATCHVPRVAYCVTCVSRSEWHILDIYKEILNMHQVYYLYNPLIMTKRGYFKRVKLILRSEFVPVLILPHKFVTWSLSCFHSVGSSFHRAEVGLL